MLRKLSSLNGYAIQATDDELGKVKEAYFDDEQWGVRYLVVDTGSWLSSRLVLISPYSIQGIDDEDETIRVSLTRDQVRNSPDIDTQKPVSRQMESEYSRYFGYGTYWAGPYIWGLGGFPVNPALESERPIPLGDSAHDAGVQPMQGSQDMGDVHLRSTSNVEDYHILGTDDDIGHVEDFMFDDEAWVIRYLLVDTRNWWPGGRKVLLGTRSISNIDWSGSSVQTTLTRDQIKNSPEYKEDENIDRDYEIRLHKYYDLAGYWE